MTNEASKIDPQSWKCAEKTLTEGTLTEGTLTEGTLTEGTLTWRSWGAIAFCLFIATIGAFAALLHVLGVI
jgi:hypothetical protein